VEITAKDEKANNCKTKMNKLEHKLPNINCKIGLLIIDFTRFTGTSKLTL